MVTIEIAADVRHELGESILWDDRAGEIVWVNIHRREIWRQDAKRGALVRHELPDRVGAIGLRRGRGYVVALAKGFGVFDPSEGRYVPLAEVETDLANTRLNDGRCDRFGNFVCGGYNEGGQEAEPSALYRLRGDGRVEVLKKGIGCANSTCFSPDGRTLYFADMPTGRIDAFGYRPDGPLGPSKPFFDFAGRPGEPDGSTVDAEGFLWNAHWGAGRITRHAPDGRIDREIPLPVSNPTCLAFGGSDLRTLYVTSAAFHMSAAALANEPLAGSVLSLKVDVPGLPESRFAG
jgi:L-arabinonolactonase